MACCCYYNPASSEKQGEYDEDTGKVFADDATAATKDDAVVGLLPLADGEYTVEHHATTVGEYGYDEIEAGLSEDEEEIANEEPAREVEEILSPEDETVVEVVGGKANLMLAIVRRIVVEKKNKEKHAALIQARVRGMIVRQNLNASTEEKTAKDQPGSSNTVHNSEEDPANVAETSPVGDVKKDQMKGSTFRLIKQKSRKNVKKLFAKSRSIVRKQPGSSKQQTTTTATPVDSDLVKENRGKRFRVKSFRKLKSLVRPRSDKKQKPATLVSASSEPASAVSVTEERSRAPVTSQTAQRRNVITRVYSDREDAPFDEPAQTPPSRTRYSMTPAPTVPTPVSSSIAKRVSVIVTSCDDSVGVSVGESTNISALETVDETVDCSTGFSVYTEETSVPSMVSQRRKKGTPVRNSMLFPCLIDDEPLDCLHVWNNCTEQEWKEVGQALQECFEEGCGGRCDSAEVYA